MKDKDIKFLLDIAKLASTRSHAVRLQVGGVVTDQLGNIIAFGYNGTYHGGDNCCEDKVYTKLPFEPDDAGEYTLVTKDIVIHAEQNLIAHAARRGISVNEGKMFITHSPCHKCSSLMVQSGIKEVFFLEPFRTYDQVYKEFSPFMKFNHYVS